MPKSRIKNPAVWYNSAMTAFYRSFARMEVIARSLAMFLGLFTLCNVASTLFVPDFDGNLWWIDLRVLPPLMNRMVLLGAALLILAFGLDPAMSRCRQRLTLVATSLLGAIALANAAQFYLLLAKGTIGSRWPVAFSLGVAVALGCIIWACRSAQTQNRIAFDGARIAVLFLIWIALFPVLQTLCFGKTDYRRPADVAVVFGARAYANGQPSDALADRVRTACELYRQGTVKKLIFSGGPGDGPVHETEAMQRMALSLGVTDQDILLDPQGLSTERTVAGTTAMFKQLHVRRVLAVSHFYHLPRIKLAYQRHGWEVYTVPARETYFLTQIPYSVAREVAAFWSYYWRPVS